MEEEKGGKLGYSVSPGVEASIDVADQLLVSENSGGVLCENFECQLCTLECLVARNLINDKPKNRLGNSTNMTMPAL